MGKQVIASAKKDTRALYLKSTYKISQTNWYLCKCTKDYPGGYFRIFRWNKKESHNRHIMKKIKRYTNCAPPETAFPSYINMYECVWIIEDIIDSQVDSWQPIQHLDHERNIWLGLVSTSCYVQLNYAYEWWCIHVPVIYLTEPKPISKNTSWLVWNDLIVPEFHIDM